MSVWVVCPSARPVEQVAKWAALWRERGYKIGLARDEDSPFDDDLPDSRWLGPYPGYAIVVNRLIADIMTVDASAEWYVVAGDDIEPDAAHTAEEIAAQCEGYFTKLHYGNEAHHAAERGPLSTLGVMQPTGDRWTEDHHGSACVDRVASSAWIGREFALRVNQGNGPLWPEYTHMFVDEELQEVATRLGVFWQRRDLIHLHNHWQRPKGVTNADCPPHLLKVNTSEHWRESKEIFMRRKRAGFPGSELK